MEMVELETLQLNERNPRQISPEAMKKLCASIEHDPQFMELRPIIVDENRVILGGNQRYKACVEMGKTEVPESWVRMAADLTDEQRHRFVLVDNAPDGMAGYWDYDLLQEDWQLEELEDLGLIMQQEFDPDEEWHGMPEYEHKDIQSIQSIRIHFRNREDVEEFAQLIGQQLTEKTRSIWFPKEERLDTSKMSYDDES